MSKESSKMNLILSRKDEMQYSEKDCTIHKMVDVHFSMLIVLCSAHGGVKKRIEPRTTFEGFFFFFFHVSVTDEHDRPEFACQL